MKSEVMSHADLSLWPTLAIVIFFGMILCITYWIFRRGSKQKYEQISRMILDENSTEEKNG